MSERVNEALLEMYFLPALVDNFSRIYGARFLKLYKPSQQHEAWVGFDQGWARSTIADEDFLSELSTAIDKNEASINNFYLGYFLQFKKVYVIKRKYKYYPSNFNTPFFRSKLSLKPNKTTSLSQHETLLRLQNVNNACVYYACPMFFNANDIYNSPDINNLRLVPISSAPDGWQDYENHFICFQSQNEQPVWLSEPTPGKSYSFKEWAHGEIEDSPGKLTGEQIYKLIIDILESLKKPMGTLLFKSKDKRYIQYLPESMTIIKFKKNTS